MLKEKSRHRSSFYAMVIICTVLIIFNFTFPPANILSWDFFGYYLYLPFTFIYHDFGLKNQDTIHHIIETYNSTVTFYQAYQGPAGSWVMKYPMGIAMLNSPFFFIGH